MLLINVLISGLVQIKKGSGNFPKTTPLTIKSKLNQNQIISFLWPCMCCHLHLGRISPIGSISFSSVGFLAP